MTTIEPDEDMRRWCVQKTVTILANSDYYYTKDEVDNLLELVSASGVTRQQVEEMIAVAIQDKANQADLEALSAQVMANTAQLLNTYTKQETNTLLEAYQTKLEAIRMRDEYAAINGTTLTLNNELEITI
jgi:hypothetical protein